MIEITDGEPCAGASSVSLRGGSHPDSVYANILSLYKEHKLHQNTHEKDLATPAVAELRPLLLQLLLSLKQSHSRLLASVDSFSVHPVLLAEQAPPRALPRFDMHNTASTPQNLIGALEGHYSSERHHARDAGRGGGGGIRARSVTPTFCISPRRLSE